MTSVLVQPERDADHRLSKGAWSFVNHLYYCLCCIKDLPHLSLTLDSPASASPFPSPSSSFVPPPTLEPREFAAKLHHLPKKSSMTAASTVNSGVNGYAQPAALRDSTNVSNPTTPTPGSKPDRPPSPSTPKVNGASLPAHPRINTELKDKEQEPEAPVTPRRMKHTSLSSSRPAPPSPSVSRRASGAPSSRPVSRAPSMSARRASRLSTASRLSQVVSSPVQPRPSPPPVKVRDFAYDAEDPRHTGQGPDAPRLSIISTASDASDSRRNSGWASFRWPQGKFWPFGGSGGSGSRTPEAMPSRSDFERNFDMSSPADESTSFNYDDQYEEDEYAEGEEPPLLPGLYRAAYAFEPEGTAEMALQEDQIVRVVGRGGGVGWAVVVKEDSGGGGEVQHALVPEGYLELVSLDEPTTEDA